MKCRHCGKPLEHVFLDLGFAPPSNAYLKEEDLQKPELYFPLKVYVCDECWLVQTQDYADAEELFNKEYAYFSSTSTSWLDHAAAYSDMIEKRLELNEGSLVVEVASNDGYLLKNFLAKKIPCLGVEPTLSTAHAAEEMGIPVMKEFFGEALAREMVKEGKRADLIIGNNVYAHVPDLNDFTRGLKTLLKPGGTITLEFPHLMRLIDQCQFDTVYHEHFSYLSLHTVSRVFTAAGLMVYDVEELPTHGGSLRVYGTHAKGEFRLGGTVEKILSEEERFGLKRLETYLAFQNRADKVKNDLLAFLIEQKNHGKRVAAYGAAAKGNTLLNYAGVKPDLLAFVCDAAASKQGKYLPGSHLPIFEPEILKRGKVDFVLVLPWNLKSEVKKVLEELIPESLQIVTAVPSLKVN